MLYVSLSGSNPSVGVLLLYALRTTETLVNFEIR